LGADGRDANVTVDLAAGDEGRDGIDDDDVDSARADEVVHDVEGLLSVVGLRNDELVGAHAQTAGVGGVEGVLGVDKDGGATRALRLGDRVKRERRLAARLGAKDLDDAAARVAAS
jgi:hypothetical protein